MRLALWILAVVLAVAVAALLVFRLAGPDRVWRWIAGPPDLGPVAFGTLTRPDTPNAYLVCPPGACERARPDRVSPVYAVPPEELARAAVAVLDGMERTRRVDDRGEPLRARFVARTRLMRFPDTVSLEAMPADAEGETPASAIAIYSRSQLGRSDLGENRRRVEGILADLAERLPVREDGGPR